MSFNRSLRAAVFLGAAVIVTPSFAQGVPTPPPAGVQPKARRVVPQDVPAAQVPQATPMAEPLPVLPEHPIKLEENLAPPAKASESSPVVPAPAAAPMTEAAPSVVPVSKRPVKPAGPVYYFAHDPYAFPANVTTPPAMHVPNSPYVEDLSVAGDHGRYTYYSYRRPWYTPGQLSANVTILW